MARMDSDHGSPSTEPAPSFDPWRAELPLSLVPKTTGKPFWAFFSVPGDRSWVLYSRCYHLVNV